ILSLLMSEGIPATPVAFPERIGPHLVTVEGDTVHIRFHGPYLPAEAKQVVSLIGNILLEQSAVYLLIDLSRADMPSMETRRVLSQAPASVQAITSVYYGVNFFTRAMAVLIHRMLTLVSKRDFKVFFATDESDGRRILESLRTPA